MVKTNRLRPAVAMLELIFAIVIMAIILMSAPQLISTAAKSGYVAIQQEAINEAASRVNLILGYYWDENDANELFSSPLLQTNGDASFNEVGSTGFRLGTPSLSLRTFIRSDGLRLSASTTFGSDANDFVPDDMDDFGGTTTLRLVESSTAADYIEGNTTINIVTAVAYNTDGVTGGYNQSNIVYNPFVAATTTPTNIKQITVTLTSTSSAEELKKDVILRAFSCNVGEYKPAKRIF